MEEANSMQIGKSGNYSKIKLQITDNGTVISSFCIYKLFLWFQCKTGTHVPLLKNANNFTFTISTITPLAN